jgi:8-oxo-dGTP diphosphatase
MIPAGHKKNAVLILLRAADQYLLLLRNKEPNKGKYQPVGGKMEAFEDPLTAAARETFEETGLSPADIRFKGMLVETSPADYNWTVFVYLAEIEAVAVPECNEGSLEWVPLSRLCEIPTPLTDLYIYKYIAENKPFFFNAVYDKNDELLRMTEEFEKISIIDKPRQQ